MSDKEAQLSRRNRAMLYIAGIQQELSWYGRAILHNSNFRCRLRGTCF